MYFNVKIGLIDTGVKWKKKGYPKLIVFLIICQQY